MCSLFIYLYIDKCCVEVKSQSAEVDFIKSAFRAIAQWSQSPQSILPCEYYFYLFICMYN